MAGPGGVIARMGKEHTKVAVFPRDIAILCHKISHSYPKLWSYCSLLEKRDPKRFFRCPYSVTLGRTLLGSIYNSLWKGLYMEPKRIMPWNKTVLPRTKKGSSKASPIGTTVDSTFFSKSVLQTVDSTLICGLSVVCQMLTFLGRGRV